MKKLILGVVVSVVVALGFTAATPAPAHATDGYGTNYAEKCGFSLTYLSAYCQLTFTKSMSETMKQHMVVGETIAAVAAYACSRIPRWDIAVACIAELTFQAAKTRDALNDAHASSQKCFAYREYASGYAEAVAPKASSVTCNFGVQCCDGGSGGGGGGGGGGSWRENARAVTMGDKRPVAAIGPGLGSGGGSW